MHQGCFVWTPTPLLSGRRTPRPGPARVCLCVLFLAGSGRPASWVRSGAPHLSCGRFVLLLCSAPSGLGLPVPLFSFPSFFLFPSRAPAVSGFLCIPGLSAMGLGALRLLRCPPHPPPPFFPFFFFCSAPLCLGVSVVSGPGCPGPLRFVTARPPPPLSVSLFVLLLWFSLRSRFFVVPAALGFCTACLGFSFLLRARPCVWYVHCVLGLCPLPASGGCSCLAVSRVLLCGAAVCCGLLGVVRSCLPVPCGAGVVLSGVLVCCVVGFVAGGLPWALSPPFLLVSCGVLLCCAVLRGALSCVVPSRVVVSCVVL